MITPAWPPSAAILCGPDEPTGLHPLRLCIPHPDEVGATVGAGAGQVVPVDEKKLTEIKARAEAARARADQTTPGPWRSVWEDDSALHQVGPVAQVAIYSLAAGLTPEDRAWGVISTFHDDTCDGPMPAVNRPSAAFIAEARTDVPTLAADVLALAEEVERIQREAVITTTVLGALVPGHGLDADDQAAVAHAIDMELRERRAEVERLRAEVGRLQREAADAGLEVCPCGKCGSYINSPLILAETEAASQDARGAKRIDQARTETIAAAVAVCRAVEAEWNDPTASMAAGAARACACRIEALAAKPAAPASSTKIGRRTDTPESAAFWAVAEESAAEVATWPEWKRVGLNVVQVLDEPRGAQTPVREAPHGEPCTHGVPGGCEVRCACGHLCRRHHSAGCDATIDTGGDESDVCPCLDFEAAGGEG